MIINIRGTSGSGKSTIVRKILPMYPRKYHVKVKGRRRPLYYIMNRQDPSYRPLMVLGHYQVPCGGCDTITNMDKIYDLARMGHRNGFDVLFEGLLISADINRTKALHEDGMPVKVIGLNLPLEICLASVNKRRWTKNPNRPPVSERNTKSKWKATQRSMLVLGEAGLLCYWADRDDAVTYIKGWLEL